MQVSDTDLIAAIAKLLHSAVSAQQEVKRLLQQAQDDVEGGKGRTTKDISSRGDLQVCMSPNPTYRAPVSLFMSYCILRTQ